MLLKLLFLLHTLLASFFITSKCFDLKLDVAKFLLSIFISLKTNKGFVFYSLTPRFLYYTNDNINQYYRQLRIYNLITYPIYAGRAE